MPLWGALTGTRVIQEKDPVDTPEAPGPSGIPPAPTAPTPTASNPPIRQPGSGNAVPTGNTTNSPAPTSAPVVGALTGTNANPDTGTQTKTDASGIPTTLPANQTTSEQMQKINAYFNDLLNQDSANWNQFMGGYQRQADIISNRLGHSAGGGGYAQLAGGALGQAALDFGDRQRQTKMAMIDKLIGQDQREQERGWQQEDQAAAAEQHYTDLAVELMGEFPNMSLGQIVDALKSGNFDGIGGNTTITDPNDPGLAVPGGQGSNVPPPRAVNSPYMSSYYESGVRLENGVVTVPEGFGNIPAGQIKVSPHAVEDAKQACYEMGIDNPPTWMINDLIMAASIYYKYTGGTIFGKGSMKKQLERLGWDTWQGAGASPTEGGEG